MHTHVKGMVGSSTVTWNQFDPLGVYVQVSGEQWEGNLNGIVKAGILSHVCCRQQWEALDDRERERYPYEMELWEWLEKMMADLRCLGPHAQLHNHN